MKSRQRRPRWDNASLVLHLPAPLGPFLFLRVALVAPRAQPRRGLFVLGAWSRSVRHGGLPGFHGLRGRVRLACFWRRFGAADVSCRDMGARGVALLPCVGAGHLVRR